MTKMLWVSTLVLVFGSGACFAQSTNSGDIRGSVTDPTGALIPGVTVTVLNVDTGVSKDYPTNQDGLYDTSSIVTGSYRLTFSKEGFEKLVRGPISLEVGFTTVNAQLQVGAATQQVEVTSDVPLLQTETSEQSTTLDSKSMSQLPQVTQDWENFMILLPGATGTVGGSQGSSNPGRKWRSTATCLTATFLRMERLPRCRIARTRIPQSLRRSLNSRSTRRIFRPSTVSAE